MAAGGIICTPVRPCACVTRAGWRAYRWLLVFITLLFFLAYICMHACVEHLCSRRPYSLDCHGGAKGMYHCALENITVFSCAQNWVSVAVIFRAHVKTPCHIIVSYRVVRHHNEYATVSRELADSISHVVPPARASGPRQVIHISHVSLSTK